LSWVSALDLEGRTIWIVEAHGYGNRFIVRADELLAAFLELQRGDTLIRREFDVLMARAETWEIRLATKICGRIGQPSLTTIMAAQPLLQNLFGA